MSPELRRIASRVVWWETPESVVAREADFLCRVMALGDWSDVNCVEATYGQTRLGAELRTSLPATFVLYGGTALALRSRDSDEALQLLEPGNRHKLRRPRTRAVN